LIEAIQEIVSIKDLVVLVGTLEPELTAVIEDDTIKAGGYVESIPLGLGVYLIIGVGDMPTKILAGINQVKV